MPLVKCSVRHKLNVTTLEFLLPKAMGSKNKLIIQEPERKSSCIELQFGVSKPIRDALTE